ncbi:MAG: YkgJ family cysteine cluster protein [Polyangiaceae bacterium]|nr:YkgJ family cysteine cluster protein [Polyangiaceae bacterium]
MPLDPLLAPPDLSGADCVACGRCCHHGPRTVHLLEHDEARMGERMLAFYTYIDDSPPFFRFIKNGGEHCACLDVSVPGNYPCAIYEHRPDDCRIVDVGSPACLEARGLGHLGSSVEFHR